MTFRADTSRSRLKSPTGHATPVPAATLPASAVGPLKSDFRHELLAHEIYRQLRAGWVLGNRWRLLERFGVVDEQFDEALAASQGLLRINEIGIVSAV